ncbi:MAG: dihydroneopterin aldolase [Oscillospiraceae bacterium]|jgi:dihydroneopterin aldolase|nr:dihydroneopterin aldolase [Clostridiales bacterium]MDD4095570.1 dihydroneopterin aldolase [Oscillospiraceae bacterium]
MAKSVKKYRNRIILQGMRFLGTTGLFEFERHEPQPFVVNLTLCLREMTAGRSDRLADTVDYGQVFAAVREIVEGTRYDLIEALAEAIASEVLIRFPSVDALDVTVRKPQAPVEGVFEYMGVRIFRERIIKKSDDKR